MQLYPAEEVDRINLLGDRLRDGIHHEFASRHIPVTTTGYGSMVGVHLVDGPVRNYRDGARADASLKRALHMALLLEGVFAAPRLMCCISTPMDDATVDDIVARFGRAIDRVLA
jgi:glutamate-1-semialdehyde 2,1-aminomutase